MEFYTSLGWAGCEFHQKLYVLNTKQRQKFCVQNRVFKTHRLNFKIGKWYYLDNF